jgi:hypothetical protein
MPTILSKQFKNKNKDCYLLAALLTLATKLSQEKQADPRQ